MTPNHRPCAEFLRCTSPIRVKWDANASFIDVRCKRCRGCLRVRQYTWICRAAHEQAFAKKTWFATLTFGRRSRAKIFANASSLDQAKSSQARLVQASGDHVQKYIKRLRKSGFVLRYVFVPELHRDGFPHWHGLVHDLRGDLGWQPVSNEWASHEGFSKIKLVKDAKAIRYVTKYLAKDTHGRIRASLKYGDPASATLNVTSAVVAAAAQPPGGGVNDQPKGLIETPISSTLTRKE